MVERRRLVVRAARGECTRGRAARCRRPCSTKCTSLVATSGSSSSLAASTQDLVQHALLGEAVVLELDEDVARLERVAQLARAPGSRCGGPCSSTRCGTRPPRQPVSATSPRLRSAIASKRDARRALARRLEVPARDERDEVLVALAARREQDEVSRAALPGARDVELAAEDRLRRPPPGRPCSAGSRRTCCRGRSARRRACPSRFTRSGRAAELHRARQERVLRVDVEVDELAGIGGRPGRSRPRVAARAARRGPATPADRPASPAR